jgi:hypothetical protein
MADAELQPVPISLADIEAELNLNEDMSDKLVEDEAEEVDQQPQDVEDRPTILSRHFLSVSDTQREHLEGLKRSKSLAVNKWTDFQEQDNIRLKEQDREMENGSLTLFLQENEELWFQCVLAADFSGGARYRYRECQNMLLKWMRRVKPVATADEHLLYPMLFTKRAASACVDVFAPIDVGSRWESASVLGNSVMMTPLDFVAYSWDFQGLSHTLELMDMVRTGEGEGTEARQLLSDQKRKMYQTAYFWSCYNAENHSASENARGQHNVCEMLLARLRGVIPTYTVSREHERVEGTPLSPRAAKGLYHAMVAEGASLGGLPKVVMEIYPFDIAIFTQNIHGENHPITPIHHSPPPPPSTPLHSSPPPTPSNPLLPHPHSPLPLPHLTSSPQVSRCS